MATNNSGNGPFKISIVSGVLLSLSVTAIPPSSAGNAWQYIQKGLGYARQAASVAGTARQSSGSMQPPNQAPPPSYTPPSPPPYTPPAPVYTPPVETHVHAEIRNSTTVLTPTPPPSFPSTHPGNRRAFNSGYHADPIVNQQPQRMMITHQRTQPRKMNAGELAVRRGREIALQPLPPPHEAPLPLHDQPHVQKEDRESHDDIHDAHTKAPATWDTTWIYASMLRAVAKLP